MLNEPGMKYCEDFTVDEIETIDGYLITAEDIISFAQQWDPQPQHTDPKKAQASHFGGLIASGAHLIAIAVHQLFSHPPRLATIGVVGLDDVKFLEPARPGDVVSLTRKCIEVRSSRAKPDRGVVRNKITLSNQDGKHLLSYVDTILVKRRVHPSTEE
jgi:acyl dehydratase